MGRRTLTATEIRFHQKYSRHAATFAPADLDGENLADILETWVRDLAPSDTHDSERQNWVQISNVQRYTPSVLVIALGVGSYGEAGPIIDSDTGVEVGKLTETQAPTGENRAVLLVPPSGEAAYYMAEESSRGTGGGRVLRLFKSHFSSYTDAITMDTATVTESEAWSQQASLKEVEVRVSGRGADIADGSRVEVGVLSHIARPPKRTFFPRRLLSQLNDREVAGRVVGISDVTDDAEVYVTMEREGRTKKFHVGRQGAPAIREVLNDAADPLLSTEELVDVCAEKVSDLAARTGGTWDRKWSTP